MAPENDLQTKCWMQCCNSHVTKYGSICLVILIPKHQVLVYGKPTLVAHRTTSWSENLCLVCGIRNTDCGSLVLQQRCEQTHILEQFYAVTSTKTATFNKMVLLVICLGFPWPKFIMKQIVSKDFWTPSFSNLSTCDFSVGPFEEQTVCDEST